MKVQSISAEQCRKIIIHSQCLNGQVNDSDIYSRTATLIEKLGYIQIDTISAVNRSHLHTLWTRIPDFREPVLHTLQAEKKLIFEYWAHAMAFLPMSEYRFIIPKIKNFEKPEGKWANKQMQKCKHLFEPIMERITAEGPLCSKDFTATEKKKPGTWWDWHPSKTALEFLFWKGKLMVSKRIKFRKYYDLTERVLPSDTDISCPSDKEVADFLVHKALSSLGIASISDICQFMQPGAARDSDFQSVGKKPIIDSLDSLVESDLVIPVKIDNDPDTTHYVKPDMLNIPLNQMESHSVHILSPFDNLIINRHRLSRLFGFDYTLECYLPEAKRKYGYFVMPVLWENRFVGRTDMKADRKTKTFIVKSTFFEKSFREYDEFLLQFAKKLATLALFNNCPKVQIENFDSLSHKTFLENAIKTEI